MDKNELEIYIHILLDTLSQKKQLLQEVHGITENQNTIASHDQFDPQLFKELMNEKQKRIQQINELDEGFQQTYNQVQTRLGQYKDIFKDDIKRLQGMIKEVIEMGMQIQLVEEKNNRLMKRRHSSMGPAKRLSSKSPREASQYYKSMEQQYKKDQRSKSKGR